MPNSPDAAPLDYLFWSYFKTRLKKRKYSIISGFKKVIKQEIQRVPQCLINKALKPWPLRCT